MKISRARAVANEKTYSRFKIRASVGGETPTHILK